MSTIAIIGGAGYVGLSYAAALAEMGHDVVGVDRDASRIGLLQLGHCPVHEPGLPELVQRALSDGSLSFTTDFRRAIPNAEFAFICVGTPSTPAGSADTTAIAEAARAIAHFSQGHTIVVNKSTMPVGSAQFVADILAEHARSGARFAVVSNPEFLSEGSAINDIFHPDRIVLGADDFTAAEAVAGLYASLSAPVIITHPRSAEMIKYASNAFLATKISFINEVATICDQLGADVNIVAHGMGLDRRIGASFLRAGLGFGGSCFPKDVRALAAMATEHDCIPTMLNTVLEINASMRTRLIAKIADRLGTIGGKRIGVLGLAFKPDTNDVREAPALALIEELLRHGATVQATDPVAGPDAVQQFANANARFVPDAYSAGTGADAVILVTEWQCYRDLNFSRLANAMRGQWIFDGRNALDPAAVAAAGLSYEGTGRNGDLPAPPRMNPIADTSNLPAGRITTWVDA